MYFLLLDILILYFRLRDSELQWSELPPTLRERFEISFRKGVRVHHVLNVDHFLIYLNAFTEVGFRWPQEAPDLRVPFFKKCLQLFREIEEQDVEKFGLLVYYAGLAAAPETPMEKYSQDLFYQIERFAPYFKGKDISNVIFG